MVDTTQGSTEDTAPAAAREPRPGQHELLEVPVSRALAIVAHPDDLEYGASALVARWTAEGAEVAYLLATRGEAGIDGIPPQESGPLREAEQRRSAAVVGVEVVEFLDHHDGTIEAGLPLRRDLVAAIRRHRPDTVLTLNHREHWGEPAARNSADHRALGSAVLDAVEVAGNRWVFPDAGDPHQVERTLVASSPEARHALDVGGYEDLAVASLAAHRSYLEGLGPEHPMADPELVRSMLVESGREVGCEAAVTVEFFPS